MPKPKIDHENIKATQRQASAPYSELEPLEVTKVWWIYANRAVGEYPTATERSGKWLVFVPSEEVNEVWLKIKEATQDGKLGDSSKVATAASSMEEKVICVYTYDWSDAEDARRIRAELRKLGITRRIPYKSDEDTLSGKYRATGHTNISKYYE